MMGSPTASKNFAVQRRYVARVLGLALRMSKASANFDNRCDVSPRSLAAPCLGNHNIANVAREHHWYLKQHPRPPFSSFGAVFAALRSSRTGTRAAAVLAKASPKRRTLGGRVSSSVRRGREREHSKLHSSIG